MSSKLPIRETVLMAVQALGANGLRSSLTMLGIIIGNVSVIATDGIGRGAQDLVESQLSSLGKNVLFVFPVNNNPRRQGINRSKTLVLEDADAIAKQVPAARRVAPQISLRKVVGAGPQTVMTSVIGTTGEYLSVRRFEMAKGRFFRESDINSSRNIAVIGPELGKKLFLCPWTYCFSKTPQITGAIRCLRGIQIRDVSYE